MSGDQVAIDAYVEAIVRRLAGSAAERAAIRAELLAHLEDAAAEGELDEAMRRLGDPRRAAATFVGERPVPAPLGRRAAAAFIDNLPLIGVTVALLVQQLVRLVGQGAGTMAVVFPPFVGFQTGGVCVGSLPLTCEAGVYDGAGPLSAVGVPLALAWSVVGLGLMEARTGTTFGKRLYGLRVVTGEGLRVPGWAGIARRSGFLLGPVAWLDWLPVFGATRQRALDHAMGTRVAAEPGRGGRGHG